MRALAVVLAMAPPAMASEISYSSQGTEACLEGADGVQRYACIAVSANACMATTDGGTTVGMGYCLGRELGFWDDRLNAVYAELRRIERANGEDMKAIGATVPDSAKALRDMQRAWMGYRDAACIYEYSTWGGGSGGGPANAACLMNLTARKSLMLEDRLKDRMR